MSIEDLGLIGVIIITVLRSQNIKILHQNNNNGIELS